jgi:hypothetical protein
MASRGRNDAKHEADHLAEPLALEFAADRAEGKRSHKDGEGEAPRAQCCAALRPGIEPPRHVLADDDFSAPLADCVLYPPNISSIWPER